MEGAPRPEHITENSDLYTEFRESMDKDVIYSIECFGELHLRHIDEIKKGLEILKSLREISPEDVGVIQRTERLEKELWDICKKLREDLIKLTASNFDGLIKFLDQVTKSESIQNKVKFLLGDNASDDLGVELMVLLQNGYIGQELTEMIVREHVRLYKIENEKFQKERLPVIIQEFKDKVLQAIEQGQLPIIPEFLEKRLQETKIMLADILQIQNDLDGSYYTKTATIQISPNLSPEQEKETIFHELVHALSGRTILKKNSEERKSDDIDHQRTGLSFLIKKDGETIGKQFRWISEAVTEEITVQLEGNDRDVYKEERAKLSDLYQKGLKQETLYGAYFENYDPDSPEKVPAWKKLIQQLTEMFPDGGVKFLSDMEKEIENERIKKS